MTREEHIDQLITYLRGYSFCMVPASSEYWRKHWKEIRESLKNQWIPCEERLPEMWENILLSIGDSVYEAHLRESKEYFVTHRDTRFIKSNEPIAWMPLPKPYEGRTE